MANRRWSVRGAVKLIYTAEQQMSINSTMYTIEERDGIFKMFKGIKKILWI